MPDRLPFGEVRPQAQPLSTFLQPVQRNIGGVGQPTGFGRPDGISTIQIAGSGNVQGFNQQQQLADALAPFSNTLTKLAGEGVLAYAKGKIEEGYWDELKNTHARSMAGFQLQQEQGATNAGTTITQLNKTDPEAARVLSDSNPWRLVGRRRAAAQLAGGEVDDALMDDLHKNPGLLSGLAPGSPELVQRKIELTQPILKKYGLTGDEPEAQFYTIPRLNQAWDKYAEKQRTLYSETLKTNTIDMGTAQLSAMVSTYARDGIPLADGTTVKMGDATFPATLASLLGAEVDKQLGMLGGNERTEALNKWRTQLFGAYGKFPQVAAALGLVPTGPATLKVIGEDGKPKEIPNPNRPTWGAIAPLENLELINKGNGLVLQQYDQQQQGIRQQLDGIWWAKGMPGSLLRGDPAYAAALIQFRAKGAEMGYTDIDGYIKGRMDSQTAVTSEIARPDPLAAEDFITKISDLPRSAFANPQGIQEIRRQARVAAQAEPTPELQAQRYREYLNAIDERVKQAEQTTPGLDAAIENALLQDLGQPPVAKKIAEAAAARAQATKTAPVNPIQQMVSGGAGAVAAIGTLGNAKIQAYTIRLRNLFQRNGEAAIDEWQATHPGVPLTSSVRNVLISGSIANTRKSDEYKQAYQELTGLAPGQVGTGPPKGTGPSQGTAPGPQVRGVPKAAAGSLPDSTAKAYGARPVMDGGWLRSELENVANGKPVSPELFRLANKAGTTTNRYLLEQLRFYPQLDPDGEARKYLQQQIQKQKAGQTVSSANYPQLSGQRVASAPSVAGFNPLAPGGWLMTMLTPPAAAATLPSSYTQYGGGGGSTPFGGSGGGLTNPVPSINIHANKGGYAADTGLDILGREGSDVVATLPGRIVYAEKGHSAQAGQSSSSRGYSDQHSVLVELDRPFTFKGKQIRFVWYSHLQGLDPAIAGKNGMRINAGQRLGAMGIANGVSHLHQGFLGNREQTVYLNAQEIKELYRQGIPGGSGPRASQGGGLTGVATFYSGSGGQDGVAGGKTANGERYNPNAMTAAIQWSLRGKYLNKWVTVEDQQTGKRVKVWVNDVGPMGGTNQAPNPRDPRIIDLSPAAFTKLFGGTSRGTGRIRIVGADGGGGPTRLGDRADAAPAGTSDGQQTASSKPSIGDQFIAQIEGEKGWEDNAGLQPLPLQRMYRQAGRPMTRGAIPLDERNNIIGGQTPKMRRQRSRETLPERSRQTIERIQKLNDIKLNWDPLEAELKQRFNNINPNPRSRLAAPSQEAFTKIMEPMIRKLRHVLAVANINLPGGEGIQIDRDVSELVSDKMASEIKGQLFRYLDAIWEGEYRKENGVKRRYGLPDREIADKLDKWDLPFVMRDNGGLGKMGNDILYEWNHRNQAKLRERTVDMIGITRDAVRPVEPFSPLLDHYSNPNEP